MQKKKGISLVVLIVTIIVLIILAGVIILTIDNEDTIGDASRAVDLTNQKQLQILAEQKWAHAYNKGARTQEELEQAVLEGLESSKIDISQYIILVTTSGVEVKPLSSIWIKDGFTVVKGDKVLKIGELVDYDETAGGEKKGLTNVQWKVLGADEDGNLLIMSASDVKSKHPLGDKTYGEDLEEAQNDWLNGAAELDSICEAYGYGKGVVGKARSITVEDVNEVTGYNPETYNSETASNGEPFGKGRLYQYGNEVTYRYSATANKTTPDYTSVVTGTTPKALSDAHIQGFYYYNEKTGKFEHIRDLSKGERGKEFVKLTSNYYYYYALSIPMISATAEESKEALEMIFGNDDAYYWLASPYVYTFAGYADFGMRGISLGYVCDCRLWFSNGGASYDELGVRAVVTLSSDINFKGSSETGWSY